MRQGLTGKRAGMARKYAALGALALLGSAAAAPVELNQDNFNAQVYDSGKNAFVKFFAPWSATQSCLCALRNVWCYVRTELSGASRVPVERMRVPAASKGWFGFQSLSAPDSRAKSPSFPSPDGQLMAMIRRGT